jgi:hypothetical protein
MTTIDNSVIVVGRNKTRCVCVCYCSCYCIANQSRLSDCVAEGEVYNDIYTKLTMHSL